MPKQTTWVLIADGARAHFYVRDGERLNPALDHDLAVPSRNLAHDAGTDRPGRSFESAGISRHAVEPQTDWKTHQKMLLARAVADELRRAVEQGAFDRLVVVAPPEMLGDLRDAFDKSVEQRIAVEIGKNLTHLDAHQLYGHIAEALKE